MLSFEALLVGEGHEVSRIYIEIEQFIDWCKCLQKPADAVSRVEYSEILLASPQNSAIPC